MGETEKPAERLKELARAIPAPAETHAIMLALESQQHSFGDYAIAIIGASLIEKALEAFILACRDKRGPLVVSSIGRDLSKKIEKAHALGLFGPKTRDDLEHIRTIRNSFAHSLHLLRFETEEVAQLCGLLHTPSTIKFADRFLLAVENADNARGRYIVTILALAGRMRGTLATANLARCKSRREFGIAIRGLEKRVRMANDVKLPFFVVRA